MGRFQIHNADAAARCSALAQRILALIREGADIDDDNLASDVLASELGVDEGAVEASLAELAAIRIIEPNPVGSFSVRYDHA